MARATSTKARESFAAAREQFDTADAAKAAIAAFDQACAAHRKGDAGASPGMVSESGPRARQEDWPPRLISIWERSRPKKRARLAGEHPENVAPEKRAEILDQLKAAVVSFPPLPGLQPRQRPCPPRHRAGAAVDQVLQRPVAGTRSRETAAGNEPGGVPGISDRDAEELCGIGQGTPCHVASRRIRRAETPARRASGRNRPAQGEDQGRADAPATGGRMLPRRQLAASWSKESRCCMAGPDAAGDKMASAARISIAGKRRRQPPISKRRSTSWRRSGRP